jgi:hypothetical protein
MPVTSPGLDVASGVDVRFWHDDHAISDALQTPRFAK